MRFRPRPGVIASTLAVVLVCGPPRSAAVHAAADPPQGRPARERPPALEVDFGAVQEDGTPITDLQTSEVDIRIDGRLRTIRSIRHVSAAPLPTTPDDARRVPPPYGTNQDVNTGRSVVLLLDEESLTAGRESQVRGAVDGLLADFTAADRAMVLALPFGGVKQAFTADKARIRLALSGVAGRAARDDSGSDMACRTRRFLESFQSFLTSQAGRPTPLTVVLFTGGMAAPRRDAPMALAPGMCELVVNHFQLVSAAAGAARANLFVLQPSDIAFAAGGWRESIAGSDFLGSDNPLEGIEHLAGTTGAIRIALDATGTSSLQRVSRESSGYFVAEVEPEGRETYGRTRTLDVRVHRPGTLVRVRPEITFAQPQPESGGGRPRLTIADLLMSPVGATDLPLRVGGFTVREPGGQLRVGVLLEPAEPGTALRSAGAVLIENGQILARWFAPDAAERPMLGAMAAAPGRYRLRAGAIDESGRAGLAEEIIDARLVAVGPLSLGSLMLGVSRDGAVVPQLEFGAEPVAIASFDIYGGEGGIALSASLEVAREIDGAPLVAVPLALARADEHRVVATGSVPLGALAPDDYVVRGVIRLQDGATGIVSRTLRKVAR